LRLEGLFLRCLHGSLGQGEDRVPDGFREGGPETSEAGEVVEALPLFSCPDPKVSYKSGITVTFRFRYNSFF